MFNVIANFKDRCDVLCGSFETRREAIECGLIERVRGATLVMIAGPFGKINLEKYLRKV